MPATIIELESNIWLTTRSGNGFRRIDGIWQMLSAQGNWFDCELYDLADKTHVADYENCLRPYSFDEGLPYPQQNKKGNIGQFFRDLQTKELRKSTKGIFAPVRIKYDAAAENLARFNREVAALLRKPFPSKHLTV